MMLEVSKTRYWTEAVFTRFLTRFREAKQILGNMITVDLFSAHIY